MNTTSGAVTVTLPAAPVDKALVAVKHVIQGGTNAVTVAVGGSDVFNKAGGATSFTLPLLAQGVVMQYQASTGIWYVQSDDLPLSQLDARYVAAANAATIDHSTLPQAAGTAAAGTANAASAVDHVHPAASSTGFLAVTDYRPGAQVTVGTTAATFADIDATNVKVTFTAPTSGNVMVDVTAWITMATNSTYNMGLRSGTTLVKEQMVSNVSSSGSLARTIRFYVTGLTAGNSYTWKLAHRLSFGSSSCGITYGGVAGTNDNSVLMSVQAA